MSLWVMAHRFEVEVGTEELLCIITSWELRRGEERMQGRLVSMGQEVSWDAERMCELESQGLERERSERSFRATCSAVWLTSLIILSLLGGVYMGWHWVEIIHLWPRALQTTELYKQMWATDDLKKTTLGKRFYLGLSLVGVCFPIL